MGRIYKRRGSYANDKHRYGLHTHRTVLNAKVVSFFVFIMLLFPASLIITTHGGASNALAGESLQSGNINDKSLSSSGGVNYLAQGFKMQIYYNSGNTARQTAAELLKTKLESLNPGKIQITVTGVEWSQYQQLQSQGKMPAFFLGWIPDYADPNDYVVPFLASQGTYLHTIGYSNATLDAMINTASSNPDPVTRDQQYKQITLDVQKECLYVWVSQAATLFVGSNYITGYHFNPLYSNLYYYDLNKTGGTASNPIDTFTYGEIAGNPDYFDPARDYETAGGEVLQNVFETLVWYQHDRSDVLIPQLCTELPSVANGGITNSDKDYTYHVRPGVTFQDGNTLDAYDVQFSLERLLRLNDVNGPAWMYGETLIPDYYDYTTPFTFNHATGAMTGGIQNDSALKGAMWVKDPMTIQFNLTTPNPAWNSILALNGGSVVSLKNVKAHLSAGNTNVFSKEAFDWVNANPVGTGPYKFKEFAPSQYVSMERYDNYWRGPATIKNVLLQQIADTTSRINQVIAGDLDAASVPRASQQAVFGHSNLQIVNSSNWNVNFLGLNQDIDITGRNQDLNDIPSDFFADLRVRQAFAHAWDFQTFNVITMRGVAIQPNGVIPKGMFGYHADIPQYDFNLTLAKQLLGSGDYTYAVDGSPAIAIITGYTGAGGAITIPSTLGMYPTRYIGIGAFAHCTALTSVTIPSSITTIGDYAFSSCTALTSVTIPSSVTSIGAEAFESCTVLTTIDVSASNPIYASVSGVLYDKVIATLMQYPCGKTGAFTIPGTVNTIGDSAFRDCSSLTSVTIPSSVMTIGKWAFANTSLTSVNIPNGVTSIKDEAFYYCTALTSVSIPSSVTTIGNGAFAYCSALTSVTILNGVTIIGFGAFQSCTALTSVTIPASVTSIGDYAFDHCTKLTSITFYGLVVPTIGGWDWIQYTGTGIRGHAYAASNFPAPGDVWNYLIMGTVIPVAPVVPGAPTGLVATNGAGFVRLNWMAPADAGNPSFTRYDIYRGTSSGVYGSPIGNVTAGTLTYNDTSGIVGTPYYYVVKAVNSAGPSPASNVVSGTSTALPSLPSAPQNLAATSGNAQVTLTWTAPSQSGSSSIIGYKVYRGTAAGSLSIIATVTGTTYIDVGLTNGQAYHYKVSAVSSVGESVLTEEVISTPAAPNSGGDTTLIIAIVAVVAIAGIGAALLYMRKKK